MGYFHTGSIYLVFFPCCQVFFVKEGDRIIVFCCLLALLASHQVFFGLLLALFRTGLMCEVSTIECCYIKKCTAKKNHSYIFLRY